MRFKNFSEHKEAGRFYTPPLLAEYVADQMLRHWQVASGRDAVSILDPAAGQGALLDPLISRASALHMKVRVVGYETDFEAADRARRILKEKHPSALIEIRHDDFLADAEGGKAGRFDLVIANPPYVRAQVLGRDKTSALARKLGLGGRTDICYAFLLLAREVLKEDGIAGFIASNKLMAVQAGKPVMQFMLTNYALRQITDLGDSGLFKASVLPCVLIFGRGRTDAGSRVPFSSAYEDHAATPQREMKSILDGIGSSGSCRLADGRCFAFRQGPLNCSGEEGLWRLATPEDELWLEKARRNTRIEFSAVGRIRIGIKTSADDVFIGDDWTGAKADLEQLRPLTTHRNAGQIIGKDLRQWKVLYPHEAKGSRTVPVDLDKYPRSRSYLLEHYAQLSGRLYMEMAHRKWHEIWIPQQAAAWARRKIVFRDISEKPEFWLDDSGSVVNGDCYWLDLSEDCPKDVALLALAVANSAFIERFYDLSFNNRLLSGKRRFQKQFVERFPIPDWEGALAQKAVSLVRECIRRREPPSGSCKAELDHLVEQMFGQD